MRDKLPVSLDTLLLIVLILPHLRYNDVIVGLLALVAGLYLVFDLLLPLVEVPERGSYLQGQGKRMIREPAYTKDNDQRAKKCIGALPPAGSMKDKFPSTLAYER